MKQIYWTIFAEFFWPASPAREFSIRILLFWLDRAWSANTCIPLSFLETHLLSQVAYLLQTTFARIEKIAKFIEIIFYNKKSENEIDKLTFGNSELVDYEIWCFRKLCELSIYQRRLSDISANDICEKWAKAGGEGEGL